MSVLCVCVCVVVVVVVVVGRGGFLVFDAESRTAQNPNSLCPLSVVDGVSTFDAESRTA